jgi:hypothetical protein
MIDIKPLRANGVPLIGVETPDCERAASACIQSLNGKGEEVPVLEWDIARGWKGRNQLGKDWTAQNLNPRMTLGESLAKMADGIPDSSLVLIHNIHRIFERDGVAQGISLCRAFKNRGMPSATLVLLAPSLSLPAELKSDVMILEDTAPTSAEIAEKITGLYGPVVQSAKAQGVQLPELTENVTTEATAAALGLLSMFDVEQTVSLAITRKGLDVESIWKRKIARIKLQSGSEIMTGCPDFSSLAGCRNIKAFLGSYLKGRRPPGCVVFMDEIEKMLAGAGTDSSGVTGKMLGQFLTWTQDKAVDGVLLLGVPGAGKSATAKATAGEARVPLFKLSVAELQGSLVGQSEQNFKLALQSIDAISAGNVLLIATCNSVESLAPELMGRFKLGTFFYDYPDNEERQALWNMYRLRYDLGDCPVPESKNWVGREIESACYQAWLFNKPLSEVARYVVPECVSQKAKLEELRESVSGRFLSASKPGIYRNATTEESPVDSRSVIFN